MHGLYRSCSKDVPSSHVVSCLPCLCLMCVQSLVNELGQRLGCGAHVVSMRREAIGGFSVENAWTLEVLLPVARMVKKARKKENRKLDGRIDR